jgi:hypothetical protein
MDDVTTEPLNALVQTLFTQSDKTRLAAAASRRYVKPSTLMRMITLQWLDENEPLRQSAIQA